MPGPIAVYAVSCWLCRVNFAGIVIPTDNALAEAFRASEGLNALRIQAYLNSYNHQVGKWFYLYRTTTSLCLRALV
jgi:hypothetical protein